MEHSWNYKSFQIIRTFSFEQMWREMINLQTHRRYSSSAHGWLFGCYWCSKKRSMSWTTWCCDKFKRQSIIEGSVSSWRVSFGSNKSINLFICEYKFLYYHRNQLSRLLEMELTLPLGMDFISSGWPQTCPWNTFVREARISPRMISWLLGLLILCCKRVLVVSSCTKIDHVYFQHITLKEKTWIPSAKLCCNSLVRNGVLCPPAADLEMWRNLKLWMLILTNASYLSVS